MANRWWGVLPVMAVILTRCTEIMGVNFTSNIGFYGKETVQDNADLKRMISAKLDKLDRLESVLNILTSFPFKCPENQMRKSQSIPVGTMKSGDHLYPEETFCSVNGEACLFLRNDGNLVLYWTATNEVLWSSGTSRGHCSGDFTNENGRLLLYTSPSETVANGFKPVTRITWAAPAITCQRLVKKDIASFSDKDITGVYGKNESDCCQICKETPTCKAYSILPKAGTCWLKSANGPVMDKPNDEMFAGILVEDTAGLELTFRTNGHLCLKSPGSADCRWSTHDLMYKAK